MSTVASKAALRDKEEEEEASRETADLGRLLTIGFPVGFGFERVNPCPNPPDLA